LAKADLDNEYLNDKAAYDENLLDMVGKKTMIK
jgi:hypothetical protein